MIPFFFGLYLACDDHPIIGIVLICHSFSGCMNMGV